MKCCDRFGLINIGIISSSSALEVVVVIVVVGSMEMEKKPYHLKG